MLPPSLAPPKDWAELEERRRTWWVLYCSDRFVSGTAGWPTLINEKDVRNFNRIGFFFLVFYPELDINVLLVID
jgi:hypothetical protein